MSNVSVALEDYEKIESIIKKIYSSGLRTKIFISLSKAPKRLCDICDAVDSKPQNVSTRIKELQDGFLEWTDGDNRDSAVCCRNPGDGGVAGWA